ncbi:hypothetical protein [Nocardioides bruguierae]|uniref:Cellulose synthase n=1 Tax=Nocardioides bruguierae TaxID=2945102 RepID=A0A9X2DAH8_9ACTN|nr:hypothetical protein [Nocardioides bruguierae]MCM0622156.1 hypothetical protein [Nocardioides bruguierae]
MDDVAWLALCTALTVLGAIATWVAFRRRGAAAGLRLAGLTLLVPAAYLTRTLKMFTRIVDAVADWVLTLVLVPTVWAGIVLAGLAVVLLVASSALRARQLSRAGATPAPRGRAARRGGDAPAGAVGAGAAGSSSAGGSGGSGDAEMDEIEALLRKRGID